MMEDDSEERPKSKSQVKRELTELKHVGVRLLGLSDSLIDRLENEKLKEAVRQGRKIRHGSGRKRQVQYIGKLLRQSNSSEVLELLARLDATSSAYNNHFHKLERWRDRLIDNDDDAMTEVLGEFPHTDRQHLRHLVRSAIEEAKMDSASLTHARKLFRFLRDLSEDTNNP